MSLRESGYEVVAGTIPPSILQKLRDTVFRSGFAGERCLLDHDLVRETSVILGRGLAESGHLPPAAVCIQAIAFDKTSTTNWQVAWHQDLMFPFSREVTAADHALACLKHGVPYARPPAAVLGKLLAARLHLDDCDETNGPLRVSPGTHGLGILETASIPEILSRHGESTCLARSGDILLMRPLALHTSSRATEPKHRRVLHFVYHSGETVPEPWHRAVRF